MKRLLFIVSLLLLNVCHSQVILNKAYLGDTEVAKAYVGDVQVFPRYTVVARVNAGGATVTATDGEMNWASNSVNGPTSGTGYSVNTGQNYTASPIVNAVWTRHSSIPPSLPDADFQALYDSERYDNATAPEMIFSFPLGNGTYKVRLYIGEFNVQAAGYRVYDINIEGVLKGDNIDATSMFGTVTAGMLEYNNILVTDGTLNIDWVHVVQNPQVNAIEILKATP